MKVDTDFLRILPWDGPQAPVKDGTMAAPTSPVSLAPLAGIHRQREGF